MKQKSVIKLSLVFNFLLLGSLLFFILQTQLFRFHPVQKLSANFEQELISLGALALSSEDVPVGAILTYKDEIIGRGFNTALRDHNIAGHAEIGDRVIIGGNCGVQQFTRVGKMAMIGGMTGVSRDVIPYGLSLGNRNYLNGINIVGLRRSKVSNKDIICLSDAYKEIFKTESLNDNLIKLNGNFKDNIFVQEIIDFINRDKKRPICTPFSK